MPDGPDLTAHIRHCNSCSAAIIWARTIHGRAMPIDAYPSYAGNIMLELRQGFVRATVLTAEAAAAAFSTDPNDEQQLRTSHFVTCPDADGWRRR